MCVTLRTNRDAEIFVVYFCNGLFCYYRVQASANPTKISQLIGKPGHIRSGKEPGPPPFPAALETCSQDSALRSWKGTPWNVPTTCVKFHPLKLGMPVWKLLKASKVQGPPKQLADFSRKICQQHRFVVHLTQKSGIRGGDHFSL